MRGSDHLKTVLKTNNEAKIVLVKSYILYYIIAILMYGYYKKSSLLFLLLSIPDLLALGMLHWLTIPTFVSENGAKKLVRVQSLNSSGAVSFFFDLMFWGLLTKILILFSRKWALLYLGVPFSLVSEFIYKPYKSIKKI